MYVKLISLTSRWSPGTYSCHRIPQQGSFLCSSFVFSFFKSDKIKTSLKTGLWNPATYRYKIVRISSAQFGLVMIQKQSFVNAEKWPGRQIGPVQH